MASTDADAEKGRIEYENRLLVEMPERAADREGNVLYGCLNDDTSSLDACIPSCLAGYKFAQGQTCTKRVYKRDEGSGKLELKNKVDTDKAYVYIAATDKISLSEMKWLRNKHKISELYVYKTTECGKYEHSETLTLRSKPARVRGSSRSDSSAGMALLLLFLLLVLLVACAVWMSKRVEL